MISEMKKELSNVFILLLKHLGITEAPIVMSRPENPLHGEYTTNIAMVVARQKKTNPIALAKEIGELFAEIKKAVEAEGEDQKASQYNLNGSSITVSIDAKNAIRAIYRLEVAGPGFINVFLNEAKLSSQIVGALKTKEGVKSGQNGSSKKKGVKDNGRGTVMVEFAHPNTHKAFHIGHLRNITTGECIVRLLESQGISVVRANYQGDVGLHIAKALYGILHTPNYLSHMKTVKTIQEKVEFLAKAYVSGNKEYEEGIGKSEIEGINKQIYAKDPSIYSLYQESRKWSLEYFDAIYKRVGTHFDRFYFESQVYESGKQLVMEGLKKGIFEKSDGAIIFPGEKYGLHNRVFITSLGTPTYEGKDMGLAKLQFSEYHPDTIIHCVSSEQTAYFQVIFRAMEDLLPETKGKQKHLVYGWVKLKEGKMSSRTGNVVLGEWLLDTVKQEIYTILDKSTTKYDKKERETIAEACAIAAVKYAFLKVGTQQEIAFDIKESINLEGDSGPYLLYTFARCQSVLRKAEDLKGKKQIPSSDYTFNTEERLLMRHIGYFSEVVEEAAETYSPNTLCTYLFQLSQLFNVFYAKHSILGTGKEGKNGETDQSVIRLSLTQATANLLQQGLHLLGIETVERM